MSQRAITLIGIAVLLLASLAIYFHGRSLWVPVARKVQANHRTVDEVVALYGEQARDRLSKKFEKAGASYPPEKVTLLAIKEEAKLELWVGTTNNPVFIHSFPIQALSGKNGPKLREGDKQVPEGLYKIIGLNPNSSYHLSMKLNYPNAFDLVHAQAEGRTTPGTNIFIHGKAVSIGCLAMGDNVIEELFVLAADVGVSNFDIVIAPTDPRSSPLIPVSSLTWTQELYSEITNAFAHYQHPAND